MSLDGTVALITGASSGIGAATALALAERGVRVALAARRVERLEDLVGRITAASGTAIAVPCDVTDRAAVEGAVRQVLQSWGRLDVLVNNAGLMPLSLLDKRKVDEWDRMIDVNLKGALYAIAAVLPPMQEQGSGHIVNMSSVAGRRVFPGGAVYCATKFGLNAITEGLRAELSPRTGIRVTAIAPGIVETELLDTITDQDVLERRKAMELRALDPEDIARAVVYALEQPPHVSVNEVLVRPTEQAS